MPAFRLPGEAATVMDFVTLGLSWDSLTFLAGILTFTIGLHCLPKDLRKPWGGGITGLPLDVLLIICGLLMVASAW